MTARPISHLRGIRRLVWLLSYGLGLSAVPGVQAQPFERVVDPFPVVDAEGQPFEMPFLGGFNQPRPQLVDLDADGDLDLFVQEQTGRVQHYENIGTPAAYRYVWRTDHYAGLDVGAWFRFADLDADGDPDLLAEQPYSHVRYYRNDGTPEAPRFVLAADTLRDAAGRPLFADAQNVPALADLTCTGFPDLFLGKTDGTLSRYAHEGVVGGLPRFRLVSERYQGIEVIGTFGKQGGGAAPQHGASAITFGDVDGSGRPDLLWGDFFSPSLYYFDNTGTCAEPRLERRADTFPLSDPLLTGGYNAPYLADVDADGDQDLFVGVLGGAFGASQNSVHNFYFFENAGAFELRTTRFLYTVDAGEESTPALADLDGDGDLDLVVGSRSSPELTTPDLLYFENIGRRDAPSFRLRPEHRVPLDSTRYNVAPAFGDIDADGDPDLFVGGFERGVAYLRNEGSAAQARYVLVDSAYVEMPRGSHGAPAFVDIDADGDLDLFVGEASGDLNFFRNTGSATSPHFVLESEQYGALNAGRRSVPAFHDADGDGDADLFLGTEEHGLVFVRNTGTPEHAAFVADAAITFPLQPNAAPAPADLDGDGDADLLVGEWSGGLRYFENRRIPTSTDGPPEAPGGVRLLGSFPNPFHASTVLRVWLPRSMHVRLRVYDALGREVARLLDGPQPAGQLDVPFTPAALPAGIYIYVLQSDDGALHSGRLVHL